MGRVRRWYQCAVMKCRRRAWPPDGLCPECLGLVPAEYLDAPPDVQADEVQLQHRRDQLRLAWERVTGEPMRVVEDDDD